MAAIPATLEAPQTATQRWLQIGTTAAVVLGLGLRLFHYLRCPSVWCDEAALIVNVLEKNFTALLGPLYWAEAAPPLFLWLERAAGLTLNDGIMMLRLPAFVASCLALLLFRGVARAVLPPAGVFGAVLLFATSESLLWHTCEAKPYAVDVCVAVAVLALHLRLRAWSPAAQCLVFALVSPVLIFLSYPGAFLCGASLLALLPAVWRSGRRRDFLAYGLWGLCVFCAFALLVLGPARAQRCAELESCWTYGRFTDWSRPWYFPVWTAWETMEVFRYCFKPLGAALVILAGVGGMACWRQGRRDWTVLLVVPTALAWLATCLDQYCFSASRLEAYAAPTLTLLVGAGIVPTLAWCRARHRCLALLPLILLAATPYWGIRSAVKPWSRPDCAGAARYVQAHWRDGDVVVGNSWEYVYYFRQSRDRFTFLTSVRLPHPEQLHRIACCGEIPRQQTRCWFVYSGHETKEETPNPSWFPNQRVRSEKDLEMTKIMLLEKP